MLMEKLTLHAAYGAVMIMDSHFGRPIATAVLSFDGKALPYRVKPDGYYVLTQPVPPDAVCRVECPGYAPLSLPVEHDANGRFFALASLSHLAGHTQLTYTRKLLGSLRQNGRMLSETAFTLALTGRISSLMLIEDAPNGAACLRLNTENEVRLLGQSFHLPDQPQSRLLITGMEDESADVYTLAKPLPVELKQGQQLTPLWESATDHKGEFVFPYKPHLLREAEAEISIICNGVSHNCTALFPKGADGQLTVDFS